MYATSWCPVCIRARRWLTVAGYRFVELDVEQDERAWRSHRAIHPYGGVPVFDIDGTIVIGFDPELVREVLVRVAQSRADRSSEQARD
jgi:glutaredoxin